MHSPLAKESDFPRLARIIGALLTIVGGVALLFQAVGDDILPPPNGYHETRAEVVDRTRRGTFREPAFSVTLLYPVTADDGDRDMIRSGRRVPFEVYNALSETAYVTIHYNPDDPFEWQIEDRPSYSGSPGPYAFGVLMIAIGLFVLLLPVILRVALRYEDFDTIPEEANANN